MGFLQGTSKGLITEYFLQFHCKCPPPPLSPQLSFLHADMSNSKTASYSHLHTVSSENVRTLVIFTQIGLYPLIKINISKWLFNNKIYNLFLTKLHEILNIKKTLFLRNQ